MDDVKPTRHRFEFFATEMQDRTNAGGAISELAGVRIDQSDEALDVGCRNGRVHGEHRRRNPDPADRSEIAYRVIRYVLVQRRIDSVRRHRRHQQGISVGRGFCDGIGADVAACTGFVLHHELLSQQLSHLRSHKAPNDVGRAAGSEGNHHAHRS